MIKSIHIIVLCTIILLSFPLTGSYSKIVTLNANGLEHCIEILPDHNNLDEDRINIVFIAGGADSLTPGSSFDFRDIFYESVNGYSLGDSVWDIEGLKGIEPFKSNIGNFNFWYVDLPLFGDGDPCEDIDLPEGATCESGMLWKDGVGIPLSDPFTIYEHSKVKNYCNLENRYVHIFYLPNDYVPSVHSGWNGLSKTALLFGFDSVHSSHDFNTFMHEFTHSFANVYDEKSGYETSKQTEQVLGPNCFSLGDIEIDSNACSRNENLPWGDLIGNGCGKDGVVDCQPNTDKPSFDKFDEWIYEVRDDTEGCAQGCAYVSQNIFRPFMACNVMSTCDLVARFGDFSMVGKISRLGVVNEREACRQIKKITGEVSDYCNKLCLAGCPTTTRCVEGNCLPSVCTPMTCADLNTTCGAWDDSCGGMIECGDCREGYKCDGGGSCIPNCVDSDGNNVNRRGYVAYGGAVYWDECSSNGRQVNETFCTRSPFFVEVMGSKLYRCPYGCVEGYCLPVCHDPYEGVNYFARDYVLYKGMIRKDTCSGRNVYEYYCRSSTELGRSKYLCPNGCRQGACVIPT